MRTCQDSLTEDNLHDKGQVSVAKGIISSIVKRINEESIFNLDRSAHSAYFIGIPLQDRITLFQKYIKEYYK
jgi:hypothetical protein